MERIFILEAEQNLRNAITILLEHAGYDIMVIDQEENAQKQIQSFKPDLILCDLTLPHATGLEILQSVRANPETTDIQFILMLTYLSAEHIQKATQLRTNGFLLKPFTEAELIQKVQSSLSSHQTGS